MEDYVDQLTNFVECLVKKHVHETNVETELGQNTTITLVDIKENLIEQLNQMKRDIMDQVKDELRLEILMQMETKKEHKKPLTKESPQFILPNFSFGIDSPIIDSPLPAMSRTFTNISTGLDNVLNKTKKFTEKK